MDSSPLVFHLLSLWIQIRVARAQNNAEQVRQLFKLAEGAHAKLQQLPVAVQTGSTLLVSDALHACFWPHCDRGIWALRVALRSAVPGIRSTNFLLVLASMISVLLFAYSSGLLFLIVYLVSSGFGTSVGLLLNGRLGLLFFVSILLASYSLVRAHQAYVASKSRSSRCD